MKKNNLDVDNIVEEKDFILYWRNNFMKGKRIVNGKIEKKKKRFLLRRKTEQILRSLDQLRMHVAQCFEPTLSTFVRFDQKLAATQVLHVSGVRL